MVIKVTKTNVPAISDSESSEEEKTLKKVKKVVSKKPITMDSDSDSDVPVVTKNTKNTKKVATKVTKKPIKMDSDSDSEEVEKKVEKKVIKKPVSKKVSKEDSSDDEEKEEVPVVKKVIKKPVSKKVSKEESSDSEEVEKKVEKKVIKKPTTTKKVETKVEKKEESSDSDEDDTKKEKSGYNPDNAEKYTKVELSEFCKSLKLKVSGSKQELIDRLNASITNGVSANGATPNAKKVSDKKEEVTEKKDVKEYNPDNALKYTNVELSEFCKLRKLKSTGKKQELIDRLNEYEGNGVTVKVETKVKEESKEYKPPGGAKQIKKNNEKAKKLLQKNDIITVKIQRDPRTGWYIDGPTQTVWDPESQIVCGMFIESEERMVPLTKKDIEMCKQYSFSYLIPEDLKDEIDEDDIDQDDMVKIDDLEDEELEDDEDEDLEDDD